MRPAPYVNAVQGAIFAPPRERHLPRVRRLRERAQRRRALARARRVVLRRSHLRAEVLDILRELPPRERVRAVRIERTARGLEGTFRGVVVWRGGQRKGGTHGPVLQG